MPSNAANVGACGWVGEHGERVAWLVAIVVPTEYFGGVRALTQRRAKMVSDKLGLLGGFHDHARVIFRIKRLILRRHRTDMNAVATHCLDIFHEIAGVSG